MNIVRPNRPKQNIKKKKTKQKGLCYFWLELLEKLKKEINVGLVVRACIFFFTPHLDI